ncbi:hypothetical protein LCM27_01825 [Ruegeria marisrubri]|uniref:hypothetical protein n=1 Tax=Ruegeria marisrubri TaxID=1685379 RepID=UPI001CD64336|nr:hypothetical protein [Ruegeria marisrubri]MCA0905131.1 hypothetical protein [Ruegeria marisrubri]
MTKIYHYDGQTGEFLSEGTARRDPVDGTPLVPGHATLIKPIDHQPGKARVFKNGSWELIDDHRGKPYWTTDGTEHTMQVPGPLPADALTQKPVLPVYADLTAARAAMVAWIDGFLAKITGMVPQYERESWPTKAAAARAFTAGNARPDQVNMINNEAQTSGRTAAAVAAIIVARADTYQEIISKAAGLRVSLDQQLEAEADPLNYETILLNGQGQAKAMAKALGFDIQ